VAEIKISLGIAFHLRIALKALSERKENTKSVKKNQLPTI